VIIPIGARMIGNLRFSRSVRGFDGHIVPSRRFYDGAEFEWQDSGFCQRLERPERISHNDKRSSSGVSCRRGHRTKQFEAFRRQGEKTLDRLDATISLRDVANFPVTAWRSSAATYLKRPHQRSVANLPRVAEGITRTGERDDRGLSLRVSWRAAQFTGITSRRCDGGSRHHRQPTRPRSSGAAQQNNRHSARSTRNHCGYGAQARPMVDGGDFPLIGSCATRRFRPLPASGAR
jgi:hypothetical protein